VIITTRNLIHYCLAKQLVSHSSAVDGDFAVVDVSGRNRNYKVLRRSGPCYFVKQIQNWDAQAIAMLQCEAACYWLPANDSNFSSLVPLTPDFFLYDPERQVLITRLITKGEDLWEHFRHHGEINSEIAGKLGHLLGTYHAAGANSITESSHNAIFPRQLPWILSSARRNSHPFKQLSSATAELFDYVEGSTPLREALDEIREEWKCSALMHGDLKLENCILSGVAPELSITIVDWELADIGDPCWDTGSILQSFISVRLMSLPAPNKSGVNFDSLRSFWQRYVRAIGTDSETSLTLLQRCLRFAAARMIQSAYEYMQFSPHLSANARCLLEVSESVLANPTGVALSIV